MTAKQHVVGNLFGNSNAALNMNIHEKTLGGTNPRLGQGGALTVNTEAFSWLKRNLNIDLEDMPPIQEVTTKKSLHKTRSAKHISRRNNLGMKTDGQQHMGVPKQSILSEACLAEFDRTSHYKTRPPSVHSRP
jgi:hypothetical protein